MESRFRIPFSRGRNAVLFMLVAAAFATGVVAVGLWWVGGSDASKELSTYLDQVASQQQAYEKVRVRAGAAVDTMSTDGPGPSWTVAAKTLREARDDYDALALDMAAIDPPKTLTTAHNSLVTSLRLLSRISETLRKPLADKDLLGLLGTYESISTLGDRVGKLRLGWRAAISAEARKRDVVVPSILRKVGE